MGGYVIFFGTLLLLTFSQSEGKVVQQSKENVTVLGNSRFQVADNLILQRLSEHCATLPDIWRCCVEIQMVKNTTVACVSLEYLEDEYGFEFNVTVYRFKLIHEKLSVRNPPAICFNVPYLRHLASICFRLHDLRTRDKTFRGCINIEGHIKGYELFIYQMDCFAIPLYFFGKHERRPVNFIKNERPLKIQIL